MATIGALVVNVAANAGPLHKGLKDARGELKGFGTELKSLSGGFGALAGAAGIGLGVGALAGSLKGTMDNIDAQSKLAERLGMTTEGLVGLEHGASLAGVKSEEFRTNMEYLTKTLGKVQMGEQGVIDAFRALGVDAQALARMGQDRAAMALADHMSKLKTSTAQAQLSITAFGRSGARMTNWLKGGSSGLREGIDDAKKLGIAFDDLTGNNVQAANDALERLGKAFEGLKVKTAAALAPSIASGANSLTEIITDRLPMGFTRIRWELDATKRSFMVLGKAMRGAFGGDTGGFDAMLKEHDDLAFRSKRDDLRSLGFLPQAPESLGIMGGIRGALDGAKPALEIAASNVEAGKLITSLEEQAKFFGMAADEAQRMKLEVKGVDLAKIAQIGDLQRELRDKGDAKKFIEGLITPVEKFGEEMMRLEDLFSKGLINEQQFAGAAAGAFGKLGGDENRSKLAAGLVRGSSEELSARNQARARALGFDTPAQRVEKLAKQQVEQQKIANGKLEAIRKAAGKAPPIKKAQF